jgi:hypothetical protein
LPYYFRTKFFEFDLKPVCRVCHEKFPGELKKRLKKYHDDLAKKGQRLSKKLEIRLWNCGLEK